MEDLAPEYVRRLAPGEIFRFRCHPEVSCFTDCCRELELALTPYDALRLRRELGISSGELLARYAVVETTPADLFPRVYLGMVDDGRGSCPFVTPTGCRVYGGRPGACRTYPLGRGAYRSKCGRLQDLYVLLTEPHCRGFAETREETAASWIEDQGLSGYNYWNDQVAAILQHEEIQAGFRPDGHQQELYLLALYNLDSFRARWLAGELPASPGTSGPATRELPPAGDEPLLQLGLEWLRHQLFAA